MTREERELEFELHDRFCSGLEVGREETIKKACSWVEKNIGDYIVKEGKKIFFASKYFMKDFREAMEKK